jgi:NAD(P)-dependent dehydrogenase (short-subunit alcohol dehydrogenase family)
MAFDGEVALVTGAASGMGQLAAQQLASAGAAVAALDVDEEGLRQTASGHESIRNWAIDVTNPQAVEAAVKQVEEELGPIERVYNAAAIMPTSLLLDQDRELIHRIMEINYGGTVNVTLATLPGMLERGRGDLINFASMAGWVPLLHFGAYNASKFAVVAFSEVLYHENRQRGVRIACVCPPPVATPLLEQAVSKPRLLDETPPIQPGEVLDAIERSLKKGELFVFPGSGSRRSWRLRRWLPGRVWRHLHQLEGI